MSGLYGGPYRSPNLESMSSWLARNVDRSSHGPWSTNFLGGGHIGIVLSPYSSATGLSIRRFDHSSHAVGSVSGFGECSEGYSSGNDMSVYVLVARNKHHGSYRRLSKLWSPFWVP